MKIGRIPISRRRFLQLTGMAGVLAALGIPLSVAYADSAMKTNRVILAGSGWLGTNGVPIYSNDGDFNSNNADLNYVNIGTVNSPNNVQSGYRWQCVELVNRLYLTQGWITARWTGNGYQMYDTAPSSLSKKADGSVDTVGAGDVICLTGGSGGNGHVAIVDSVSGTSIYTRSQNLSITSDVTAATFTWDQTNKKIASGWSGYTTKGIIHAPGTASGGGTTYTPSTPAAVARSSTTMAVFFNDGNNHLANWSWDVNSGWSFQNWSDNISGQPAVVSRTSDSMDVFYYTAEHKLINRGWTSSGGWSGPNVLLSSGVYGDPAVVARDSSHMQVFFRTNNNEIKCVSWDATNGWNTNAQNLYTAGATTDPAVATRGTDNMEVFFGKNNGNLVHLGWSSEYGWATGDYSAGNGVTGKPSAISRDGGGKMSAYYQENPPSGGYSSVGEESWYWQTGWAQQDWSAQLAGSPSAITGASNVIDVFYRETGGNIVDRYFTGYGWSTVNVVCANSATGNPFAIVRGSNIEVFYWNGTTLMDANWNSTNGWTTAPIG